MSTWEVKGDWDSYKPLLKLAVEQTKGGVWEFGMGEGSTELLHTECNKILPENVFGRICYSYESNEEYFNKFPHIEHKRLITDWENHDCVLGTGNFIDVVLIDHAPGEMRHVTLQKFADRKAIFILHDSEPPPCGGNYMYDKIWPLFKYKVDLPGNPVWTTAVSNHFDVTQWVGINGIQKFREL